MVSDPEPRHIGKYELLGQLGHGGMATVYHAFDPRLERHLALKVIHRHLRESGEVGRRFNAEARTVAKLNHPNIVEIYDVSDDDVAEQYLVVELVTGPSLRQVLTERGALPPEIAACVGVELASALGHAHERGVVHRDVKPENVLFALRDKNARDDEPAVRVKITDFGIAKILDQQGVTSTGQVLGSPAYMAPEQIECDNVDARADVFSLGVLIYECMTGKTPFEGRNPAQVLRRVLDGAFTPADRARPVVGARWAAILAQALQKAPGDRYASMTEFRQSLCTELDALGLHDRNAELASYFADGASYEVALADRLTPLLLRRGEDAQRAGNVIDAAASFNRFLAFRPGDAAVLARVTGLARRRAQTALGLRALRVLLGSAFVASASWATARFVRRTQPLTPPPTALTPSTTVPMPAQSAGDSTLLPDEAASAFRSARVAPSATARAMAPAPTAAKRAVHITVNPPAAMIEVDRGSAREAFDLGPLELSTGAHRVRAFVRDKDTGALDSCCEVVVQEFTVALPTEGEPTTPLDVHIRVPFRNAILENFGPPSATVVCGLFNVSGSAAEKLVVKMAKLDDEGECTLRENGRAVSSQRVRIRAGETKRLYWKPAADDRP